MLACLSRKTRFKTLLSMASVSPWFRVVVYIFLWTGMLDFLHHWRLACCNLHWQISMPCCLARMLTCIGFLTYIFIFLPGLGSKSYEITTHKSRNAIVFMSMSIKRLEFLCCFFVFNCLTWARPSCQRWLNMFS